ncbi:MAG: DUF58 domain-containing protein [Saprospiraceae bacterium]|nr:DUF58 domain-containing protein [Saprospiraceae bacterium]
MIFLKNVWNGLYLHRWFFYLGAGVIFLFITAFFLPALFLPVRFLLFGWITLTLLDIILLFRENGLYAKRKLPEKMSNGDQNQIDIIVENRYNFKIDTELIDEIPIEFQFREFYYYQKIRAGQTSIFNYSLRPVFRGVVSFGKVYVYVSSPLRMVKRRYAFDEKADISVFPSFVQMKKYELMAFSHKLFQHGLKKVRKLGHTMEFEKIKEYVAGDDFRTVNWKATAKSSKLMVNQYQDEKSQSVYCILDKGRVMKMPFDGLSLLDYAINACLVVTNVVLRKQDYVGFFSFSRKVENRVVPDRRSTQMQRIMEALYNVKTDFYESDYGRLYGEIKKNIPHRSLLLLFTNFETLDGLNRQLPYLKAIAKNHLLIVVFFHNTELDILIKSETDDTQQIFDKIIAEKFVFEKKLIVSELRKYGIQSILSKPEDLTINTINKYLEIKSRGMI